MSYRAALPTFAGGEIAPAVSARYDTSKYGTALERARNTLGLMGGGAYNRPGFEFCAPVQDYTKASITLPFTFSTDQSYALEFSDYSMRVFSGGAPVTRPRLTITGITNAAQAIVTIPDSGYEAGWDVYFDGVEGMVEINGLTGRVVLVAGDDVTVDIDTTDFGVFTGDTGGVAGGGGGGTGGYPPVDPDAPPPDIPYDPEPPPRCVWERAFVADGVRAADAKVGQPLTMMSTDGEITYAGAVQAISFHQRAGVRLFTTKGVKLTCSTTAPVPVLRGEDLVYIRAERLQKGDRVRVQIKGVLMWDDITRVAQIGPIRVAQISANDGIYLAGDREVAGIFTHNVKPDTVS